MYYILRQKSTHLVKIIHRFITLLIQQQYHMITFLLFYHFYYISNIVSFVRQSLTREVISRFNSKLTTVVTEISNPFLDRCRISSATLHTIYSSNGRSKALVKFPLNISGPEPESGFESKSWVLSHFLWGSQYVLVQVSATLTVVVVPGELDRTTTIVALSWCTWEVCVLFVAIVFSLGWSIYFLNLAHDCNEV